MMSRKCKKAYVDKYSIGVFNDMQKYLCWQIVLMVPGNCKNAKVEISPGSLHRCGGVMRALHELPVFDECWT